MSSGPAGPVLEVDGLSVAYRDRIACAQVTVIAQPGEVLAVCGGNGAGKSTLLRAITGLVPIAAGTVHVSGHDVADLGQVEAARALIGWCPDRGGLIRSATLREHIGLVLAARRQRHAWPHAILLAQRLGIEEVLDNPTAEYSHGISRRASVLLACLNARRLLLLDEPFDGLDPIGAAAVTELVAQAAATGITCVVTTHLLELLEPVCNRAIVMREGRIRWQGPPAALTGPDGATVYRRLLSGAA